MTCDGCDQPIADGDAGTVWIVTQLGMIARHTHRDQDCARRAVERAPEQPARRIPEPRSREQRMRQKA